MRSEMARLRCGKTIPLLGMGTYCPQKDRESTISAVHQAIKIGYRHFDTAKIYGSEEALGTALGKAISYGTVQREDIFVTSKLWSSDHHDPVSALKQTLKTMGLEYLDSYLVHWPIKLKPGVSEPIPKEEEFEKDLGIEETWQGMERCLEMGLCESVGVSNFSSKKIFDLLDFASVFPSVNQVEMHPLWRQSKLRKVCEENNIHLSGYSPLGGPGNCWGSTAVIEHPVIKSIALKHNATPAQVALRWGMSKGASVIVKSFNGARMRENKRALEIKLDDQDLSLINQLEEWKIMRGDFLVNQTTSPYKSIQQLWDDEI
uniref:Aldo-keto reductase family 4 member C9 n=2 Tax=Noccaea caerulescens TaxID=107243 RepID=A0A1J3JJY5_NOCCA